MGRSASRQSFVSRWRRRPALSHAAPTPEPALFALFQVPNKRAEISKIPAPSVIPGALANRRLPPLGHLTARSYLGKLAALRALLLWKPMPAFALNSVPAPNAAAKRTGRSLLIWSPLARRRR